MKRYLFISIFIITLLSSCAPDPRREADAYATRTEAEQRAADETQARQNKEQVHTYWMDNFIAWQANIQNAVQRFVNTVAWVAPFTAFVWMIGLGVAGVHVMLATSKAYSVWANNKANLISLDKSTRQYPLFITRTGKNVIAITNPNDNSVMLLDENKPADRQKILAMANVQYAGALAQEAVKSENPGEVTQIYPPRIVDVESE